MVIYKIRMRRLSTQHVQVSPETVGILHGLS